MKNIILIGMPGCGKTSIGKLIAEKLSINFIDTDDIIEKNQQKTISEIFSQFGEEKFRQYETEALKQAIKEKNTVISTGGGIVVKKENINILRDLENVIFIDREIKDILETLDSDSRPLLKGAEEKIYKLYSERYEKYKEAAKIIIKNNKQIEDVCKTIIEEIK